MHRLSPRRISALTRALSTLYCLLAGGALSACGKHEPSDRPADSSAAITPAEPALAEAAAVQAPSVADAAASDAERSDAERSAAARSAAERSAAEPDIAGLDASYHPPEVIVGGSPRLYPLSKNVWIYAEPSSARQWIGFLWFGASVALKGEEPRAGQGCAGRWHAIEPRGFVCVDDRRATLDPEHPLVRSLTRLAPNLKSPWPHLYGESIDLRRYEYLPDERLQRMKEWYYPLHQERVARARSGDALAELNGIDLTPAAELTLLPPPGSALRGGHDRLRPRSTVAWSRETSYEGRSFLLADDLWWMPKDRVIVYPTVTFQGVHLGRDANLPLAFFRGSDRPKYERASDGSFNPNGRHFARLSWVELSGERVADGADTYLATRTAGIFVRAADAVLPEPRAATPWGTPLDAEVDDRGPQGGRQTWLEASILGGWMLAYEGRTPVFATLISAGRGGPARRDQDAIASAATPTGSFKITGKFATATMVSVTEAIHSAVPWAQNFSGPYAVHSAYWHNDWGELKSGGCINVSPIDGRWLFHEFTEPRIPDDWHGVRWLPSREPATTLLIRR